MSDESRPSGLSPLAIVAIVVVGLFLLRWVFGAARAITTGLLYFAVIGGIVFLVLAFRRE